MRGATWSVIDPSPPGPAILILVASSAALGLLMVCLLLWRRRSRWLSRVKRAKGRAGTRYPVILIHGLFGFDELEFGGRRHAYFRGVSEHLHRQGALVHVASLQRVARVSVRARQLAACIEELSVKRVNVIAHSMGGLDARYAVARLGLARNVASVITIATPHRGTPLADLGNGIAAAIGLRSLLRRAGVDVNAFSDLTSQRAKRFNREVQDDPNVYYGCVVAQSARSETNRLLRPTHQLLSSRAGANDGLVPVTSQLWGDVLAQIEADHWAQIGWSKHFDAAQLFEELMRELRGRGF